MLTLIWRESARANLRAITTYIADRNVPAAERLEAAIEACAERLTRFPFMYRSGRMPGTREAVIHPNYILVYRDAIEIVSVVHARRGYP